MNETVLDDMNAMLDDETTLSAWDIGVGITYIVLPLCILPVYMIFNYMFMFDSELKKLQSYKLLVHLGFFDCMQLLTHASAGVLTLFKSININYPHLVKFLGATVNTAWVGLFPISLLIAVNRLLIVTRTISPDEKHPWFMTFGLFLGWAYFLAFYVCCLTFATVTYFPDDWCWGYAGDDLSYLMSRVEFFVSIPTIVIIFLIYVVVVMKLAIMKQMGSTKGVSIKKDERNILIQALILFVNLTLLINCWHHYALFLPETKYTYFVINLYWILFCGLNPLLYFTTTKTIRNKFLIFVGLQQKKTAVVTITSRRTFTQTE